jgi:tetratricopeptide (TPR) repeat protein
MLAELATYQLLPIFRNPNEVALAIPRCMTYYREHNIVCIWTSCQHTNNILRPVVNGMLEPDLRIPRLIHMATVLFCLAGQLLCGGCSKGLFERSPEMDGTWRCDAEADDAMERQDYRAGLVLHQRFLEKEPGNALALYHLGYAYGQTGDHRKEVVYYEKAIGLGFEQDLVFFNAGMAYGELNQGEKSIRAFKKALDIDPASNDNLFGLAMAYQRNANDRLAEREFLKVIESDPGHLDARLHLSMLYADRGDLQSACVQLRKILELDPTHQIAREFLESIQNQ